MPNYSFKHNTAYIVNNRFLHTDIYKFASL